MQRRAGAFLVGAMLLAACSPNGDDGGTTTTSSSVPDQVVDDDAVEEVAVAEAPPAFSGRPDLPGLLDLSDERLPDDPAVRTGTIDNGMRYYIRRNDRPGGMAELRLAIRAGSVDEVGPSTGVAHFVEHMLFNGTEEFPENELIEVLRSFGAAFGADINAYTSWDETVYSLSVANAAETVELGLTVLDQWLSFATFDPDQVAAERGVVVDEWRVRTQSTRGRLLDVASRLYLGGSPYDGRMPIGSRESVAAMEQGELREFYETWYRPDNAAIVVVGDIDVDAIEADIARLFGDRSAPDAPLPERPDPTFAIDLEPDFGLHVDPDQTTVDVEVTLPLPAAEPGGTRSIRSDLIDTMVFDALVRRLRADVAAGAAPFDEATHGSNSFVEALDAPALYAFTDAARVRPTLQALLDEYERAYRYGFTTSETDLARDMIRSALDGLYEGRATRQDVEYADEYVGAFLSGTGVPSLDDQHAAAVAILDAVTPEALDLRFRARWVNSAPHVIVSTPQADAGRIPTRAEVLSTIAATAARELAPREVERELPAALMQRPDPVAPATREILLPDGDAFLDPVEITYPNGVRVIVNTNDIVDGRVFMLARSPGGTSLVDDSDVVDALYAVDVVTAGGIADLNSSELERVLASDDVEIDAWLTPYDENFGGSASSADLETLFQLLHLYMTAPRFDPVALTQVRSIVGPVIDDPGSDPSAVSTDAVGRIRYGGEPRYRWLPDPAEFATLDLAGVERVWRGRFGNASDWVFVFSGDVDSDAVVELADSYLGTLPALGAETWIDVEPPPPSGIVREVERAGTGDTASVTLLFTSPIDDVTAGLRANAAVADEVVSARLTTVIREQLGDTYSPFSVTYVTVDPDPVIETYVRVTGAPDRVEAIGDLVVAELADLAANGPGNQEFFNAYALAEEEYGFVDNGSILTELLDDATHPALDVDDYLFEPGELQSVTADSVRDYVATHMPAENYIQVTVLPR